MTERDVPEVIRMEPRNGSTLHRNRERLLPDTNSEKLNLGDFVTQKIINRKCCKYVQDLKCTDEEKCCCGRNRNQHDNTDMNDGEWSTENNTTTFPSNTFGEISFGGFGHMPASYSLYIRVGHDTDTETLWTLLSDYWHMKPPKLLISVTGGAKDFYMKPNLLNTFQRGLIKAATSTGAWIVTGGTNTGVMKYVGEAVRKHVITTGMAERQMVAIGVATWGIVANKTPLIGTESDIHPVSKQRGKYPAKYDIEDLDSDNDGVCALDHNHTHFVLVDDGTEKKFGGEIKLRASLEEHISELSLTDKDKELKVPVVLLVIEGGPNTLETAARAAEKKTPVVAVRGSGRAADLIAEFCGKNNQDVAKPPPDEFIKERAAKKFNRKQPLDDDILEAAVANIKVLMEKDNDRLVTVINLDDQGSATEIDQAILHALMKSKKSNVQSQLNLALAWNRSDVARKEIFAIENRREWKDIKLKEAMFTALVQNKEDFAQLFLDCGVDLKTFLKRDVLQRLYSEVVNKSKAGTMANLLQHLLHSQQKQKVDEPSLSDVGKVLIRLLRDQFKNVYKEMSQGNETTSRQRINSIKEFAGGAMYCAATNSFMYPEWHLFLWATLLNRRELAILFWKSGKDHIGSALRASALLKALATEADNEEEGDLSISLRTNSQFFETLSAGVLNECYKRDKNKAHKLLVRPQDMLNRSPVLPLANSAELMNFMGHSCCQTKLTCLWMGKIALYTPLWKIIAAMFLPPVLFWIKFSTIEPPDMSEDKKNAEKTSCWKRRALKRKPHEVSSSDNPDTINFLQAIYYYHTAPIVKFLYHTLAHLIFLCVFSFFLLTDLHPISPSRSPSGYEYLTWICAGSMLIEEFRQMITRNPGSTKISGFCGSLKTNMSQYFTAFWNWLDLGIYIMLITSIALRCTLPPDTFIWAQRFYAVTLVLSFMRFLNVFFVWEKIGPKVIMIKEMLYDLASFIIIMATFLLAYGISAHALQFPNSLARWDLLLHVVYHPYWNMYGELSLDNMEGNMDGCPVNGTWASTGPYAKLCPRKSWLVMLFFAVYMILTHVLLLNLLIAMFSYTFQKVQNESRKVWKYYRYTLVDEYLDRPAPVPPLICFSFIFRFVRFLWCTGTREGRTRHKLIIKFSEEENRKLTMFERAGMEDYMLKNPSTDGEQTDAGGLTSSDSDVICRLERQLAHQSKQMQQLMAKLETLMDGHRNYNTQ